MAYLSFPLKIDERAERILDRYPMIDGVKLVKLDALYPESFQAVRTGAAQMLESAISDPPIGSRAYKPALGRHGQSCGIRVQCLSNQRFADAGTVRVGRIDKANAPLHGPTKKRNRLAFIPWGAPHSRAGDAHRAKANLSDGQFSKVFWGVIFEFLFRIGGVRSLLIGTSRVARRCLAFRGRTGSAVSLAADSRSSPGVPTGPRSRT